MIPNWYLPKKLILLFDLILTITSLLLAYLIRFDFIDFYDLFWIKEYDSVIEASFPEDRNIDNDGSKELIESIQELLSELGYSPGPIDGVLGKRNSTIRQNRRSKTICRQMEQR